MRILIASDPCRNLYVGSLVCGLDNLPEVTSVMSGAMLFWMPPRDVHILHFQWPEVLFPGGNDPTEVEFDWLDRQLALWKGRVHIVATIHNRLPHLSRTDRARRLFATVYKHCHGFIHLGEQSVAAFREDHPSLSGRHHIVIPHGTCDYFENTVSKAEARRWLGIEENRLVVLAFGNLRHKAEWKILLSGFRKFKGQNKLLLIAGIVSWPHSRLLKLYGRLRGILRSPVVIHNRFIPDATVQYYLNAADVLVAPRSNQLNSGNVPLGFTFGKIVVGPRAGVMGELLQQHDNPTFVPGDAQSLADALSAAVRLLETGKPRDNRRVAFEEWSWPRIAEMHLAFYRKVMKDNHRSVNDVHD